MGAEHVLQFRKSRACLGYSSAEIKWAEDVGMEARANGGLMLGRQERSDK